MINGRIKSNNGFASGSPASEAAGLLIRVALGLLFIVTPSLAFVSRKAVVILVPVALAMLVIANTIISEDLSIFRRIKLIMSRIAGFAAFTLAVWSLMSLLWTPFPDEAGEHLLKAVGTVILGFAACLSLPLNTRASNLHLVTLGVMAASTMSVVVTATVLAGYRPVLSEGPTIARAAIMLALVIWPAIAWLKTRAAYWQMTALLALVAGAILSSGSHLALLTFATGLGIFCTGWLLPRFTAWTLVIIVFAAIIGAPVLAVLVKKMPDQTGFIFSDYSMQALKAWGNLIESKPLHMLTGYGFETSLSARQSGMLISNIVPSPIVDLWYDLGIIGALSVAVLFSTLIVRCVNLPSAVTAAVMAEIVAATVFSVYSNTVTQIWFLSSLAVASVAFMAVKNGQHRTSRPKPSNA